MEELVNILVWSLAVFGASNGIAVSNLLQPLRDWAYPPGVDWHDQKGWVFWKYDEKFQDKGYWEPTDMAPVPFFGKLFQCTMCLGFWVGIILSLVWFSPTTNIIFDGFFGSATSWMFYLLIKNRQFGS